MANFTSPFFVILYKNLILRKRHWILTIFEIVIPIIFFLLIAFTRSKIPTFSKVYVNETTHVDSTSDEVIYTRLNIHDMQLLYAPKTTFTSDLIRKTQLKLSLYNEGISGFQDELELLKFYNKHGANGTCAVVLFHNVDDSPPRSLQYDLKMYEKHVIWNTKQLFTKFESYVPGIGSETYLDKGFVPIQLALDRSFIEIASGKAFPVTIDFQEFPYPPHVQDNGINNIFLHILPIFTVFGFVLLCPSILKRVVEEKSSGIKELMKIYGLKSGTMLFGWFINGFSVCLISVLGIVFLLKTKLWGVEYAPVEHCNWLVLTIFLFLYCSASINMLFLFSTMFNKPTLAMVVGICFWIISFIIFSSVANNVDYIPWFIKSCLLILPNISLFYGYSAISIFELREMKLDFSNLCESPTASSEDITMGFVLLMLFLETIVFFVLAVYFDNLYPGPFGIAKPWYYPLRKFTRRGKNKVTESDSENSNTERYPLVEKSDLPKKIKIQNLTKKYGNKPAVNGINLEINEHQITGLLGHNGAGKTTTMFMLTGMINPTSGNIYMDGCNLQEDFDDLCSQIAFCPQHNLLFPDLTVSEHLTIFGMLKGLSRESAQRQTNKLLEEKLKLFKKRNEFINKLSGGMKRKVSLGIALMGDSSVIILDEPTAGIDVEGRRGLWDLILSYKNSKTILISTHFMEEADVLSDRIAIMDNGYLLSYATPLYLKKKYDIGYHLSIEYNTSEEGIKDIEKRLPEGSERKYRNQSSYKYTLPNNKKNKFCTLFKYLNSEKEHNTIALFNIINTTLEDVYLRVISGANSSKETNENVIQTNQSSIGDTVVDGIDNNNPHVLTIANKKPGYAKLVLTLFRKRYLYFCRKWISYTVMPAIMLLVTLLVVLLSGDFVFETSKDGKTLPLNLGVYGETGVYYSVSDNDSTLIGHFSEIIKAQRSKPYSVGDVSETIAAKGSENIAYYQKRMVVAAEFNMKDGEIDSAKAMYSNNALHGAPISLNIVMNAIAKMILGSDYSISVSNTPLHSVNNNVEYFEQSSATSLFLWLTLFPLGPLFIMANVILFTYTENATKVKLLQKICGASYSCLFVNYTVDFLYCFIFMVLCTLVLCFPLFGRVYDVGILITILLIYTSTSIPVAYVFSYSKSVENAYTRFLLSNMCVIPILTLIVLVMELSTEEYYQQLSKVLRNIFAICPQFTLNCMLAKYSSKMVFNYNWNIRSEISKKSICAYDPNPCCFGAESCADYQSYFTSTDLSFVWITIATAIVIMGMLSLNEYEEMKQKIFSGIASRGKSFTEAQSEKSGAPTDQGIVLDVQGLKKSYLSPPWVKSREVVKGLTFKVNKSECFGILGINGAGKSTTFRMLAKQECYSGGSIHRGSGGFAEHRMGYCPQQDALIEEFTGRELLKMFAQLRGLPNADEEVTKMLNIFDLDKYADKCCGTYSGGNKRKLNTCLSMIGLPLLILLDEPTTGVDPVSRRKLWNMIAVIKKQQSSGIILTSHSMDECQALCDRLMIMKDGKIVHEGTITELRAKQGSGFTVKLKLTKGDEANKIKEDLHDNLAKMTIIEDQVKEEHGGLIQIHVEESNWSDVFDKMEKIIPQYKSIEDYTVNEASLEDLFLKIARDEHVTSITV